MYRPPTDLIAMRDFVSRGVTFTKGQAVSPLTWKFHGLDMLLSRRWIAPRPETYGRRGKENKPAPTYMAPKVKNRSLGVQKTVDLTYNSSGKGFFASVTMFALGADGWTGPKNSTIWWGDGSSSVQGPWSGDSFTTNHQYPVVEGWKPGDPEVQYTMTLYVDGEDQWGLGAFEAEGPYFVTTPEIGALALAVDGVNPLQVNGTLTSHKTATETSQWEWDWGDGSNVEIIEGTAGLAASHVYAAAGEVTVRVYGYHYPAADNAWYKGWSSTQTLTLVAADPEALAAKAAPKSRKHRTRRDDDEA